MSTANQIIQDWEEDQREAAKIIIEAYGEPNETTPSMLIWYNKGRWKKIIASKEGTQHDFPFPHLDFIEGITDYRVAADKFSDLAAFDGSVTIRRTQGEISARCHDEQANFLAINLANDIIVGKLSVEEARKAYVNTMIAFRQKKPTPYMEALQFAVQSDTIDSDVTLITEAELKQKEHEK
ncbi:MAG: hypothetical protein H7Y09_14855 [Chitinophagaceae bacterium]|nr:hypothetical protein [Anaerolineae bacterium]